MLIRPKINELLTDNGLKIGPKMDVSVHRCLQLFYFLLELNYFL